MITIENKIYNADLYLRLSREKLEKTEGNAVNSYDYDEYDDKEKESGSITNQRAFLMRYCKENNIKIHKIYADDGVSGATFDRPEFNKMIKDIEDGKVNMVIVKDLSRLGRISSKVTYYTDEYFPEHKIRFIAVADGVDTGIQETSSDDMAQFKAFFNEWFLRDCSKKTKNGKRTKAKDGKVMTTYATYGYKKDPKDKNHYIVDKAVAPVIKKMFELAKQGKTPTEIARVMTSKNVKLPCDVVGNTHTRTIDDVKRRWNRNTVKRILVNPVYLGYVVNSRYKKINYKSKKIMLVPKEDWIMVPNMHEAIVDKETFDIVQEQIKARTSTRTSRHEWLLCGLLKCAECGKNISIGFEKSKYTGNITYYTGCNTYRLDAKSKLCTPHSNNLERLTEVVIQRIRTTCKKYLKLQKTEYKKIAEEEDRKLKQEINNSRNEETNLKKQIVLIENKIKTTYNDKVNGVIDEELFTEFYKELNSEKKILENKLKEIQNSKENMQKAIDFDKIVEEFITQKKVSRATLVQLVDKITISQDKVITIYYKFNILNKLDKEKKKPYENKTNTTKIEKVS